MFKKIVLHLILFYQKYLSWGGIFRFLFLTDKACRYSPTCSEYTYQAVEKHGVLKGLGFGFGRILRCHPFSKKYFDPVP